MGCLYRMFQGLFLPHNNRKHPSCVCMSLSHTGIAHVPPHPSLRNPRLFLSPPADEPFIRQSISLFVYFKTRLSEVRARNAGETPGAGSACHLAKSRAVSLVPLCSREATSATLTTSNFRSPCKDVTRWTWLNLVFCDTDVSISFSKVTCNPRCFLICV